MANITLDKYQNKELSALGFILKLCNDSEEKHKLYELFKEILTEDNSYLQDLPYSFEDFNNYFFSENSKVLIVKKGIEIIAGFYIKPNFPGKGSHISNCGYIVKSNYRKMKIGSYLAKCSIDIARELKYESIIFNCVFKENVFAVKLWEKLGFKIIGTIPKAVKNKAGSYQDGYIMFMEL